jgi:N-hydroxyarylamine O-acetyltransferase
VDVSAYLQRIGYAGPLALTAETLRALHLAHMRTVPFENLDIALGRPIVLEEEALFDKIVRRRRGGFCYELNGLFAALLRELGFQVTLLSARVADGGGDFGPDFDHLTLRVDLAERWLADVGFGDCFGEPLRYDDPGDQARDGRLYRLAFSDREGKLLAREDDDWDDEYLFRLEPCKLSDFVPMCHWHQTSPESIFTRKRVCTLLTPTGRLTLSDDRLIVTEAGERSECALAGPEAVAAALRECFGVELDR